MSDLFYSPRTRTQRKGKQIKTVTRKVSNSEPVLPLENGSHLFYRPFTHTQSDGEQQLLEPVARGNPSHDSRPSQSGSLKAGKSGVTWECFAGPGE